MLNLEQLGQAFDRLSQQVWEHEQVLQPSKQAPLLNRKDADSLYSAPVMARKLSAVGEAPLSLNGLRGQAAVTQPANIPEVSTLPQLGDQRVAVGTAVHSNGITYRRSATAWVPLMGTPQAQTVAPSGGASTVPQSSGGTSVFTQPVVVAGASPSAIVPITPPQANMALDVVITQDVTGYTISWGSSFLVITSDMVPTTPNSVSICRFIPYNLSGTWYWLLSSISTVMV